LKSVDKRGLLIERIVEFDPAYDERNNPKGNYGIHGVNLRMILKGSKGVWRELEEYYNDTFG